MLFDDCELFETCRTAFIVPNVDGIGSCSSGGDCEVEGSGRRRANEEMGLLFLRIRRTCNF
jgi:hypothetical protein